MKSPAATPRSASRLFATYVIASLVPVLALGLVLADTYRGDANARGLAEGRAQAGLLAHTAVEPLLAGGLRGGLTPSEIAGLRRMSAEAVAAGQVVRLRVRALNGTVLFSSDGTGLTGAADDEALDAAHGRVVSDLTRLDADNNPTGPQGIRVAEVYRPLSVGVPGHRIGVLEVYLPYAPIARDVTAGLGALYRDLGLGLAVLYLLLAAISLSATRRLRAQVASNAYLAEHDVLTGLPNRDLFHRRVVEAASAADRGGAEIAVAVIDLDRFKEVNDTLGHGNGDALLRELGRRLGEAVGGDDTVARLGGDEFGLVLSHRGDPEEIRSTLMELRRLLQQEIEVSGLPIATDASIGFALSPADGTTVETLLQHADVAMYVAKSAHAGVVRYDSGQDNYDSGKLALVAELRRAIAGDELVLHYQPKASVSTGEIVAVEALVRWNHPDRGLLYPDAFLPIAEQTGIIDSLTRWVLATALAQLNRWGASVDLAVAINVSARNLSRADFADGVLAALAASGVPAERLLLEITETALFADPERAACSLRRLAATGVRISLDDFGCGQTSLSYLSTLPLHEVKIDKSFVLDMLADRSHAAIVRSVIDLAHNLGFEVVAEGVETEQILAALTVMGCDIAQGYLLARPMPAALLPGWLASHQIPIVSAAPMPAESLAAGRSPV
jgi:diguanylate cyclase (GGDEF)-like protein